MKTFIITTTSTCYTDYIVKAESQSEAEQLFWQGEHDGGTDTDFRDETIESVKEEK